MTFDTGICETSSILSPPLEGQFGTTLEIITDRSQEGSQFCRGFGGMGGISQPHVPCAAWAEFRCLCAVSLDGRADVLYIRLFSEQTDVLDKTDLPGFAEFSQLHQRFSCAWLFE